VSRLPILVALAVALASELIGAAAAVAAEPPCHPVMHEAHTYTVCEFDPNRHAVRLFWKRPDGEPYNYLDKLPASLGRSGGLRFAANAGMFHPDFSPVGLYVENGRELKRISTRSGPGNFHLKPNGVFYVAGGAAAVADTESFLRHNPKVDFATQSGPMLVIDGRLHPRLGRAQSSHKYRDGIGVRASGTVVFAISEDAVSFAEFARLFRDPLGCRNALFLDGGSAPALYAPALKHGGNLLPLGPLLAVYDRAG
jgi:uncharacterized protein YigE (DUF2233 family)